jgi:Pvc16 N-terminal domain/IPT/TIG domain
MSNSLAIATVTATLDKLLEKPVDDDVPGAKVTMVSPETAGGGLPATRVNIFLYQVTPSAAARNEDLPTRSSDGERLLRRPRIGLDLHYLFTFYGRESDLEPQRLLGTVVRTLHARPVLTRSQIRDAITAFPLLAKANLADDVELVKFTQTPLTLEELSKLWSVFFQTPYRLSVAYQGTVVLIESEDSFSSPLPVRLRNVYVETFREPRVEAVVAASGDDDPILDGAQIRVRGERLQGNQTRLVIDGTPLAATTVADTEITATLPSLTASLHALQVEHVRRMGTPEVDHGGVDSNIAAFVLTPEITKTGGVYDITLANQVVEADGTHSADVTVKVAPQVAVRQRVALLLNGTGGSTDAYTFPDEPRTAPTGTLTIRAEHVQPGTYLVRIQVDGADSPLDVTGDTYSDPQVTL